MPEELAAEEVASDAATAQAPSMPPDPPHPGPQVSA